MATLAVPIAKLGIDVDVDPDMITDVEVYKAIFIKGCQALLGRGLTKFPLKGLQGDELEAMKTDAFEHIQKTLQSIYDGTVRIIGRKKGKTGIPRAVMTEAMRSAREAIKSIMRKKKMRLSDYKASDITKAATSYLEANPQLLEDAKEVVRKREEAEFDVSDIQPDEILSAKQAGKTVKRSEAGGLRGRLNA